MSSKTSTRHRIKYQANAANACIEKALHHLHKLDDLQDERSVYIMERILILVAVVEAAQAAFKAFDEGL